MRETIRNTLIDYIKYKKNQSEFFLKNSEIEKFKESLYDEKVLSIATYPTGGLGDYIISSKLIDELKTYGLCKIDVYCENIEFGKAIYEDRENMRVMPASMYDDHIYCYDLAMKIEHFVHVNCYNPKRLMDLAPKLHKIVETIRSKWNQLYLNIDEQCYRDRIHFQQMKKMGLNRYTELQMGGLFKIEDMKTYIPMRENAKVALDQLNGCRYITFNYGADAMNTNKMQLKVWPLKYYEELIDMIKVNYPDIKIVQLGEEKAKKTKNADYYVLGENLEGVKWILKESLCHIDCEGGLVHLATQLGTHCVVIFGPTPVYMYGYPQNTNIVSEECNDCMGLHPEWAFECFRNENQPSCIYGITALRIFEYVVDFMRKNNC